MEIDSYFIGQLASSETIMKVNPYLNKVKVNGSNQLQFLIEINNELDIPNEFKKKFSNQFVRCYESNVNSDEWDKISYPGVMKVDKFLEFARDKLFIFKVEIDEENYNGIRLKVAKNSLIIKNKPKHIVSNNGKTLTTIPIFNEFNMYKFDRNILDYKSIGNYEYLQEISSPYIVSGDFLYGEFKNFEKLNDGWHVDYEDEIKKVPIDFNKYKDDILVTEHALYLDENFLYDTLIENALEKQGNPISKENPVYIKKVEDQLSKFIDEELISEEEFLEKLIKNVESKNLVYDTKQIINFHTAIKTRRLVILCGQSGTGKTQLVYNYAESLGINQSKTQFNLIPVKPIWTDDSDLIGYLDTINNIYRPSETGLIDTLIEAKDNKENIYIICFDEMNLAKVEHYFSQFLSVLELEGNDRKISLYNKEFIGRVFNADRYPPEVPIRDNVFFVGTINQDESSNSLPDKVLDRCNLIELNTPENYINLWSESMENSVYKNEIIREKHNGTITKPMIDEWVLYDGKSVLNNNEIQVIKSISELFNTTHQISIGFRILNHINSYLANLPNNDSLSREEAFDLQISQKILPKIRGNVEELNDIFNEDNGLFKILSKDKFKISNQILNRKKKELDIYGYTY
ncbi:AAA family ATPase [Mammaliicoccus sciuri]|uniref:McrB family protein n=1 Tax=Mammaliicoccus sciuri TaxID=1296 RepID=UPI0021D0D4F2|nr:AAA family ATPase [Mammaliicoccus sciuri]UXU83932.1 AAA family ATPase [Mammaliicoccus sciuri]UXU93779.1 AAA family ATPase [Mammaliicoccus sciuri]UXV15727.1 AAA family ATPase [Mammaliicoccus sciuri]UXV23989.1 AAA family ATPase [Mammaliicoccus sciuri]UXV26770.1 AAA family ATPase [Mammaliicoccus sciuri]